MAALQARWPSLSLAKFQLCANMKDAKCCLGFPSVHSFAFGMED
jgi:hypothetical protein